MADEIPGVCFIDDVARVLRTSRRQIQRLRRYGSFPIPEMPALDSKRPRWSGEAVRKFRDEGKSLRGLRRVG